MSEKVMFVRPWTSRELYAKARRWQIVFLVSFVAMAAIALIAPLFGLPGNVAIKLFFAFFGLTVVAVMMDSRITAQAKSALSRERHRGW